MSEKTPSQPIKKECQGDSIRTQGVSKRFGNTQALDKVDLVVEPDSIFALLGPNGSGKTTFIRILTTLLRPDSGQAAVGGFDVVREAKRVRGVIGLAGQYPAVDEDLTGRENLEMIGELYHLGDKSARARAGELLEQFALKDAAAKRVRFYSGGMRRRLDLAATLVAKPAILFLDEPTTGLDPQSRIALWDVIAEQARDCNAVFLTTQYLEEADRLAHKIAIINQGRIIRTGTPQELKTCCGGESRISLRLVDHTQTQAAQAALLGLAQGQARTDFATGEISFPASDGPTLLPEVVRRLDQAQITLAELSLKQPTLDDVFLAITGRSPQEADGLAPEAKKTARGSK
jgi:ABC-2 type transport system ATP-binding protein